MAREIELFVSELFNVPVLFYENKTAETHQPKLYITRVIVFTKLYETIYLKLNQV